MQQYELERARAAISKAVSEAISAEYEISYPVEEITLDVPKERKLGDLAFPTQSTARRASSPAPDVAAHLAVTLAKAQIPVIGRVEHVGPYLNFHLSEEFYSNAINEALVLGKDYGNTDRGNGKAMLVEYSAPNSGKPMHFGHIRSTILGDAAVRLLKSQGYKVSGMNYIGDSGSNVAELLVALKTFKDLPEVKTEADLLQYYVKIKSLIDSRPDLKKQVEELAIAFERGDSGIAAQIKQIYDLSYPAFQKNYDILDVKFDEVIGESHFVQNGLKTVQECLQKDIAHKQKDGSIIAKLEKYKLPDKIILRANGTTIYFTRDLALADYKWQKYKFEDSFVFTAAEQNMHFKQLQKVLELLGRPYFAHYKHVGFGLVNLPTGKISTRAGNVILLDDVLKQTIEAALAELKKRQAEEKSPAAREQTKKYTEKDLDRIAFEVGIGSVKFAVLRIAPEKAIAFDFKRIVSFEGDTGAYVQYSLVRCAKIIAKSGKKQVTTMNPRPLNDFEKRLAFSIARYPEVLANAARGVAPHTVCEYLLELSPAFSSFYENCPVIQAPEEKVKNSRIGMVKATQNTLENALGTLNIRVPQNM